MWGMKLAGAGKSLPELREALFGPSKSAKAFRAVMKDPPGSWKKDVDTSPLLPLAAGPIRDLAESQVFKTAWDLPGWSWEGVLGDHALFARRNGYFLKDLKQWLDAATGTPPVRLSKWTGEFLRQWVNTDARALPKPSRDVARELRPFRPDVTRIYYRGIRFHDVGEMVKFHQHFGSGKAFPFESDRHSSWAKSKSVAERFGRYNASGSHNDAMSGWFSRARSGKDYDGTGGYVIGARIAPDQCLVDIGHHDLPFGGGRHGNEGEVILLPGIRLTCKVYEVFGDPEAEVEQFLRSNYPRKSPSDPHFLGYPAHRGHVVDLKGDSENGEVWFDIDKLRAAFADDLSGRSRDYVESITRDFNRQLYEVDWLAPDHLRYARMTLPKRVAHRWLIQ